MAARRSWRTPTSRGRTARCTRTSARTKRGSSGCSSSSASPGASRATSHPKRPARSTRAASSGYALSHAFGAAFDNPDLIVACVIGDGEAETGPLATSWHGNKFLNPARDGGVLPILHLNGYKIANPCFLARIRHDELISCSRDTATQPHFVDGRSPQRCTSRWRRRSTRVMDDIAASRPTRENAASRQRPTWPMIVLRTPKGWTGPNEIDGKLSEGYWRCHQVPMGEMDKPEHIAILEKWMKSYRPEELFDESGRSCPSSRNWRRKANGE